MDEAVFALWDSDSNGNTFLAFIVYIWIGLIDAIEFFCALVIYSNSRIEDKIRCKIYSSSLNFIVLFEFFDFNDNNFLDE